MLNINTKYMYLKHNSGVCKIIWYNTVTQINKTIQTILYDIKRLE